MHTSEIKFCPLCKNPKIQIRPHPTWGGYHIECPVCGRFEISEECTIYSDVKEKLDSIAYILSGLSRELFEQDSDAPKFLSTNIEEFTKHQLVPDVNNIEDKANKLLVRLREKSKFFGDRVRISWDIDFSLAYAKNQEELIALIQLLDDSHLVKNVSYDSGGASIKLSAKAWNVSRETKSSTKVFIAAWFADEMDPSINTIKEAISQNNFIPVCLWGDHFAEKIIDKALGEIRSSRFLVVDLTNGRPSVFYESGFAQALDLQIIYVYKKSTIPQDSPLDFYTKHYQCHEYESLEELKEIVDSAIKARIKR